MLSSESENLGPDDFNADKPKILNENTFLERKFLRLVNVRSYNYLEKYIF